MVGSPTTDMNDAADQERLASLIVDLQSRGLKVETAFEKRPGGAGPSDAGMIWIEGTAVTVPVDADFVAGTPYTLQGDEDGGFGIYANGQRLADATPADRPRYYDLTTADGIPYWQLALLHLDSLASTVLQTCAYWGNEDQCHFCGIGLSLDSGHTVAVKRPDHLAEVAVAAKELDGAVDVTLTTGSTYGADKGAFYVSKCGQAVKEASGLPVEVQFEPPDDLAVIDGRRRPGNRLGRHPHRDLRPDGPRSHRTTQVPDGHRPLLRDVGVCRRAVRRRTGVDIRHPRYGGRPGPDHRGLPAGR